jgi:hypothetical protein
LSRGSKCTRIPETQYPGSCPGGCEFAEEKTSGEQIRIKYQNISNPFAVWKKEFPMKPIGKNLKQSYCRY